MGGLFGRKNVFSYKKRNECGIWANTETHLVLVRISGFIFDTSKPDQTLRSLVDTDEEADEYMNVVFELCTAYGKISTQNYKNQYAGIKKP